MMPAYQSNQEVRDSLDYGVPPENYYLVPDGKVDEPFFYVYDADRLTDGQDYQSLAVTVQGGYDFILRRIVGFDSVLDIPAFNGTYWMRSPNGAYISSSPLCRIPDQLVLPEMYYLEQSQIRFDLNKVLKRNNGTLNGSVIYASQVGFQGVRRRSGRLAASPYRWKPKPYTYTFDISINVDAFDANGLPNQPIKWMQEVQNYDFDLFYIQIEDPNLLDFPTAKIIPYNSGQQQLCNAPIVSTYLAPKLPWGPINVSSGIGGYNNGAFVPPLYFPQNSQFQFDFYSLLQSADNPTTLTINLIGMQRIPL